MWGQQEVNVGSFESNTPARRGFNPSAHLAADVGNKLSPTLDLDLFSHRITRVDAITKLTSSTGRDLLVVVLDLLRRHC